MNVFKNFVENSHLSVESTNELENELEARKKQINPFPLHVFHPKIKPYLSILHQKMDLPKSFIGISLISAYSSAIGTSYAVQMGGKLCFLPVWACMEGLSSSGKSFTLDTIFRPLQKIQNEFDLEWLDKQQNTTRELMQKQTIHTVLFRDVHIATLVRSVMPDNPKGVSKIADEILEFINGMNSLAKKEGTDEQFWLSAWNGSNFSGIRSGKDKFVVPRVFANVIGGIQPSITYKLFAKDRDTTGFIFRFLFATPEAHKIALPDMDFDIPMELEELHHNSITKLYKELAVNNSYDTPNILKLDKEAVKMYEAWKIKKIRKINQLQSIQARDIHSGIFGKISDYTLRFCGILNVSDQAFDNPEWAFIPNSTITADQMCRALELSEYFYTSAAEVYERVNESIIAPPEVIRIASMFHARMSYQKIGDSEYKTVKSAEARKKKAERTVRAMILKYPKVFRANEK